MVISKFQNRHPIPMFAPAGSSLRRPSQSPSHPVLENNSELRKTCDRLRSQDKTLKTSRYNDNENQHKKTRNQPFRKPLHVTTKLKKTVIKALDAKYIKC